MLCEVQHYPGHIRSRQLISDLVWVLRSCKPLFPAAADVGCYWFAYLYSSWKDCLWLQRASRWERPGRLHPTPKVSMARHLADWWGENNSSVPLPGQKPNSEMQFILQRHQWDQGKARLFLKSIFAQLSPAPSSFSPSSVPLHYRSLLRATSQKITQ